MLDVPKRSSSSKTGESVSRFGSVYSSISAAATAVSSVGPTSPVAPMNSISTIARGLTIMGSVSYRCKSSQEPMVAGPQVSVNMAGVGDSDLTTGLSTELGPKRHRGGVRPPRMNCPEKGSLIQDGKSESKNSSHEIHERSDVLATAEQVYMIQMRYDMVAHFQQDLHTTKAGTQFQAIATGECVMKDTTLQRLDEIKGPLEHMKAISTVSSNTPPPLSHSLASQNYTLEATPSQNRNWKDTTSSSVSGVLASEGALVQQDRLLNDASPSQIHSSATIPETFTGRTESVAASQISGSTVKLSALSPISPLTQEEQLERQPSVASRVAPVTPLTPARSLSHNSNDTNDTTYPHSEEQNVNSTSSVEFTLSSAAADASKVVEQENPPAHEVHVQTEQSISTANSGGATADLTNAKQGQRIEGTQDTHSKTTAAKTGSAEATPVPHLADYVEYKPCETSVKEMPIAPLGFFGDDKMPATYKNLRFRSVPKIDTGMDGHSSPPRVISDSSEEHPARVEIPLNTGRARPQDVSALLSSSRLALSAMTSVALRSVLWLQRHSGEEPPVEEARVRIRWKCECGERLYDDFIELRPGAASRLETRLNQHKPQPYTAPRSSSKSSRSSFAYTPSSSHPSSSATSYTSTNSGFGTPSKPPSKDSRLQSLDENYLDSEIFPYQGSLYLLTCVNEARNTTKLKQLPLHNQRILSDKDLAVALRHHYASVNGSWCRKLRLRGLTSIEFVQLYKHTNSFADIRKCPDVPPSHISHDYEFDPSDLLPPVGPHYLVHLFQHPHEYDDEKIAFLSIPTKTSKLPRGIGWGIQLTEGFLPERIWAFVVAALIVFGTVFALVWSVREHDMQAGFGVASFVMTLIMLFFGFIQACLG